MKHAFTLIELLVVITIMRSPDDGRTWQVFAIDNGGKVLDAETDLIRLRNGWFYAVMRGSKCNGHYSTSVDGKNWTTAADIGFLLHCPELMRVELAGFNTRDGGSSATRQNAGVYKHPVGLSADTPLSRKTVESRRSIILLACRLPATALYWSADECNTWNGPVVVDKVGGAYPSMVTLKDGSVLIVYYEEGKTSNIRCRKFFITKEGVTWKK